MKIPFLDLKAAYLELKDELDAAYRIVMESGRYILGEDTSSFETEWAEYCGAKHCVGVGNGLDALHLTLRAMEVGPGDEVIVPSHTYIATWLAVSHTGATPIPVEPDLKTYNIDPNLIERAISSRTKAIIPVHLYGRQADIDPILDIANRYQLSVLEDAAQAHGAITYNRRIGGPLQAAAWSFYPSKNLGAFGDGGAVTTNDDALADRLRMLHNYGSKIKYEHTLVGLNSRLDPLQAAFLRVKLGRLNAWNKRRKQIADCYLEALSDVPQLLLPNIEPRTESVWHLFAVRLSKRDELRQALKRCGIETLIHYPIPPHLSFAYRHLDHRQGSFPIAESISNTVLSLPIGPHLSDNSLETIICEVRQCCGAQSSAAV